jgi:hypothetical protein
MWFSAKLQELTIHKTGKKVACALYQAILTEDLGIRFVFQPSLFHDCWHRRKEITCL